MDVPVPHIQEQILGCFAKSQEYMSLSGSQEHIVETTRRVDVAVLEMVDNVVKICAVLEQADVHEIPKVQIGERIQDQIVETSMTRQQERVHLCTIDHEHAEFQVVPRMPELFLETIMAIAQERMPQRIAEQVELGESSIFS